MGKVTVVGGKVGMSDPRFPKKGIALNDCTWEQIAMVSDAGLASEYFSVGDAKTITINGAVGQTTFSNLSVEAFVIGIDHNADVEGENRIHFQLGKIDGVDVCFCDSRYGANDTSSGIFTMTTSDVSNGGWSSSHMRKTILGSDKTAVSPEANTLLAALPSDLRATMKSVTKYSDNVGGASQSSSNVTATTDYLWLLSEFEVHGVINYANTAEQNYQIQYEYYKSGNSKEKYNHGNRSSAVNWWLRSTRAGNEFQFCVVSSQGTKGMSGASNSQGVAPCFAV